jgi:hypothetical protein
MAKIVTGKDFECGDTYLGTEILGNLLFPYEWMAARLHVLHIVSGAEERYGDIPYEELSPMATNITLRELAHRILRITFTDTEILEEWSGDLFTARIHAIERSVLMPDTHEWFLLFRAYMDSYPEAYRVHTIDRVTLGPGHGPYTVVATIKSGDGVLDHENVLQYAFPATTSQTTLLHVVLHSVLCAVCLILSASGSHIHHEIRDQLSTIPKTIPPTNMLEVFLPVNMRVLESINEQIRDRGMKSLCKIREIMHRCTYSDSSITCTISELQTALVGIEFEISDDADMFWSSYDVTTKMVLWDS